MQLEKSAIKCRKEALLMRREGRFDRSMELYLSALEIDKNDIVSLIGLLSIMRLQPNTEICRRINDAFVGILYDRKKNLQPSSDLLKLLSITNRRIASFILDNYDQTKLQNLSQVSRGPSDIVKLTIITCLWKRPALTKIFLNHYNILKNQVSSHIKLNLICVGSEEREFRGMVEDCGFQYINHPNEPLSEKWERGAEACRFESADAFVVLGSDDFLCKNTILLYRSAILQGINFLGFRDMYLFDPAVPTMTYWKGYGFSGRSQPQRLSETIGMGRMLSRELLAFMGYSLWAGQGINKSLDFRMRNNIMAKTLMPIVLPEDILVRELGQSKIAFGQVSDSFKDNDCFGVDVKYGENVTPMENYHKDSEGYEIVKDVEQMLYSKLPSKTAECLLGIAPNRK